MADRRWPTADGRTGFTIIELLVAMSLVILIMSILAGAFQVGLETFSKLKAIGDMSDRLRAAAHQIRNDLRNDHFEGAVRLSDPTIINQRVREGFFMIKQFGPSGKEGDSDGIGSFRAPIPGQGSQALYMTVKLKGNRKENFFGASAIGSPLLAASTTFFNQPAEARNQDVPGNIYMSQWAEVAYCLKPLNNSAGVQLTANGTPLFSLHRIIKVLIADNRLVNQLVANNATNITAHSGFSYTAAGANFYFNTPLDVTDPTKRSIDFTQDPIAGNSVPEANVSTLLLSDVVSFDIQIVRAPPLPPPPGPPPANSPTLNFGYPAGTVLDFEDVGTYDTGANAPNGTPPFGILAVQITLRVWDLRTQQTRQVTILQDM
jgi:hypothetical protein